MVQKDGKQTLVLGLQREQKELETLANSFSHTTEPVYSTEILTLHVAPQTRNNLMNTALV